VQRPTTSTENNQLAPEPPVRDSIYPTALTPEQKNDNKIKLEQQKKESYKTAISSYLIPTIIGLYSLNIIFQVVKSLLNGSALIYGAYAFSAGGTFSKMLVYQVLFSLTLAILGLILSHAIFRGSKIALALMTGPIFIYLLYSLTNYLVQLSPSQGGISNLDTPKEIITVAAEIILAGLFILAWTREKKQFI
jgi:lysylphosphatidylglycerol synthetase-like protein (DUF2156 family)